MSSTISSSSRVSTASIADTMLSNLRRTQGDLLTAQTELSTNKRVNKPSDDPTAFGSISTLNTLVSKYDDQITGLGVASSLVSGSDGAMSDLSDMLLQAQNIASSQIGATSDPDTRTSQAAVIDSMIDSAMQIANRQQSGIYLFSGRASGTQPFVEDANGIRYVGSSDPLTNSYNGVSIGLNTTGSAALGALSSRVAGTVDLDPAAGATTRLSDVNGARGLGVSTGAVTLNVDGTSVNVDLTNAASLGNVQDIINQAINGVDPTAGALAVSSGGFTLTAAAGHTISIADQGTGVTAADLGIAVTASGASTVGGDVDPKLTMTTSLASLGVPVDLASGLKITAGQTTKVVSFAGATTVQDLVNAVQASGLGLRMEINSDGTGLNLVNETSGNTVSIGENSGGTTATDLGLRSFAAGTSLADFNHGQGVGIVGGGKDDMTITLHDGTSVNVKLDGALSVQDVLNDINTAGGGSVTAALATDGNGIVLNDTTVGAGAFNVAAINGSTAAADLGIAQNGGTASTINGTDTATIRTESIITHLIMLRDALKANDTQGITAAGGALGSDVNTIAGVRATAGVLASSIQAESSRASDQKLQTQTLLSGLQDADITDVVTRFTQLQQQLQATLTAGAQIMQKSLLDFLTA